MDNAKQMARGNQAGALLGYKPLFRNGANREDVSVGFLISRPTSDRTSTKTLSTFIVGIQIMDCAERMLKIMELLEVPGPLLLIGGLS